MRVKKILREVKRIDEDLHDALKRALKHPLNSYYHYEYAQFTSLRHAINSGFKWKDTDEGHEYWRNIICGIDSAKDGSNHYFDMLSFISEKHNQNKGAPVVTDLHTPRMLINKAVSENNEIGGRIQIEYMRYNPGLIDVGRRYISMYNIIGSINWAATKEGFSWWEKLRNEITDNEGDLIPEKLKNYESTT
jgi:hypothetical protein